MSILSMASRVQVYFHAAVPIVFQTRSSRYASMVQMGLQNGLAASHEIDST